MSVNPPKTTQPDNRLIGREREQAELKRIFAAVKQGQGGLLLLAGEAGAGSTRLAEACLGRSGLLVLRGVAASVASSPYGPLVSVLREYLRLGHSQFEACGPLASYLALILPELGTAPESGDRTTLFEALRCAFISIAQQQPAIVFLDDLQWADHATLELLPALAAALLPESLLILGAYRSDEIPRGHPMRAMRNELRRTRQLRELVVDPLSPEGTAALAASILGQPPAPKLAATLYERTQGIPLFVEELSVALSNSGRVRHEPAGLALETGQALPLPETIRDAVLLRLDDLSEEAWRLLQAAAVSGQQFDLDMILALAGDDSGLAALIERQVLIETEPGVAAFRHALTREAVYAGIIWTHRRTLHRQAAGYLEATHASPAEIAMHWQAGNEPDRARQALILAADSFCAIHAYRDATTVAEQALELWPEGEEEATRLALLDRLGHCAQLSGMLAEAARAWQEVASSREEGADQLAFARVLSQLATVYELQGAWSQAISTREKAAGAFATNDLPGDAAAENLAMASHIQMTNNYTRTLELTLRARSQAERAGRTDLLARAMGLEGHVRAKLGQVEAGRLAVQAGLALALERNEIAAAAEIYQRLAGVLEQASELAAAVETYETAYQYCENSGASGPAQICLSCLANLLRQTGQWERAIELLTEVLHTAEVSPVARLIALGGMGLIQAIRGDSKLARRLFEESIPLADRFEGSNSQMFCAWGLAIIAALEGDRQEAARHFGVFLEKWWLTEEAHYAVEILRWAVTFFAEESNETELQRCAEALTRIATQKSSPMALAALAYALAETAFLARDLEQAVRQFDQACALYDSLELPFDRAEIFWRAGVALKAAGQTEAATDRLVTALHIAEGLGAKPLEGRITRELLDLGEDLDDRLGRRAAIRLERGGLTARQFEVLRLMAQGLTNPEIAQRLTLSPRTIDMHVSNVLDRLDSRSRTEAVHKASQLGLLEQPGSP